MVRRARARNSSARPCPLAARDGATCRRVLIADELSPAAEAVFAGRGIDAVKRTGLDRQELIAIIGAFDGLAVRSATRVTGEVLAAAGRLKVVGRAGIGVDNIDLEAATGRGVVVMNTPYGNSVTTAEHTISLMLAMARQIPAANASTRAGKWEKSRFMGVELMGKTLGLIGCGNIGAIVADRAQGLKLRVVAYDPFLALERAADLGVEKVELDELLAHADIITLHTPLTEGTRNILSRESLSRTKPGVRIVNCARGGLLDEAALHEALIAGHVRRCGIGCVRGRAGTGFAAVRARERRRDPASGCRHRRGAGECRGPGGRADQRLSRLGCDRERPQHAVDLGRGGTAPQALHAAR